jgi:hypothetical protein
METIKAGTMAELLKLSPEARKGLAKALYPQQEKHTEPESLFEISNAALELCLRVKRMRAVAESFADEYIDTCNGITCAMSVAKSEEHYEALFNAMFEIMAEVDKEAEKLHLDLDGIYKEA